jgi:hypothetical protein
VEEDGEIYLREVEKPKFNVAVTHWVQANNIPSVAPDKSLYGLVVNVDDAKKLLHVYFDDLGGEKVVPFHTSKLRWYESMGTKQAEGVLRMLDSSNESSTRHSTPNKNPAKKKSSPRSPRV